MLSEEQVDKMIEKLLSVRSEKPFTPVNFQEQEIVNLVTTAREVLQSQPVLLELEAPIKVCGKEILNKD